MNCIPFKPKSYGTSIKKRKATPAVSAAVLPSAMNFLTFAMMPASMLRSTMQPNTPSARSLLRGKWSLMKQAMTIENIALASDDRKVETRRIIRNRWSLVLTVQP